MQSTEPYPSRRVSVVPAHYIVGQDAEGHWLAIDPAHRTGGIFRDREAAIHFAGFETGHAPGGVELSAALLHLTM